MHIGDYSIIAIFRVMLQSDYKTMDLEEIVYYHKIINKYSSFKNQFHAKMINTSDLKHMGDLHVWEFL